MYARYWIALAVVVVVVCLAVVLAPGIAALARAVYEVGRRQLSIARDIWRGRKEN